MRAPKTAGPPRIYSRGDRAITPDGPGIFLGYATYEVIRLGMHAGRRRYIWMDSDRRGSYVVNGPLVFQLARDRQVGQLEIGGYVHDQLQPAPAEEGP